MGELNDPVRPLLDTIDNKENEFSITSFGKMSDKNEFGVSSAGPMDYSLDKVKSLLETV